MGQLCLFNNKLARASSVKVASSAAGVDYSTSASIATIPGHTPLIFANGAGAGGRNAIGLVLVCGMAIGTIFTLYVLPSVYMLLAIDHSKAEHLQAEYQS